MFNQTLASTSRWSFNITATRRALKMRSSFAHRRSLPTSAPTAIHSPLHAEGYLDCGRSSVFLAVSPGPWNEWAISCWPRKPRTSKTSQLASLGETTAAVSVAQNQFGHYYQQQQHHRHHHHHRLLALPAARQVQWLRPPPPRRSMSASPAWRSRSRRTTTTTSRRRTPCSTRGGRLAGRRAAP